jgi:uncharacterized spore protein YtfJ
MEHVAKFLAVVRGVLSRTALKDAVVSKPLSVGPQQILVLSDVSVGLGAGGGTGADSSKRMTSGSGGGSFGGAKARPVAVLVVEKGQVRLEPLGN